MVCTNFGVFIKVRIYKTDIDHSIFVSYDKLIFISVYMDNFLIIGDDLNIINELKNKISKHFCMTDLALISYYLSIFVLQTKIFVNLDQKNYLEKVFLKFGIDIYKPAFLPIDPKVSNNILFTSKN